MLLRTAAILIVFALCATGLADGKFFSTIVGAEPGVTHQRALIVFDGKTQTMVIESAPSKTSADLAWLVPVPSRPTEVKLGKLGVLSYLEQDMQPQIQSGASTALVFAGGLLLAVTLPFLSLAGRRSRIADPRRAFRGAVGYALLGAVVWLIVLATLFPVFAEAGPTVQSIRCGPQAMANAWTKLGPYEARWVAGTKGLAWLRSNSFAVDPREQAILTDYAASGWCFFVARLAAGVSTRSPRPISLTFRSTEPIYPMRLTGLVGRPLGLDLYVVANGKAECKRMTALRTARLDRLRARLHPSLRDLDPQGWFVTRLSSTLDPSDMRRDLDLEVGPAQEGRQTVLGHADAAKLAGAALLICLSILALALGRRICFGGPPMASSDWIIAAGLLLAAIGLYAWLPKAALEAGGRHRLWSRGFQESRNAQSVLLDQRFESLEELKSALERHAEEGDAPGQFEWESAIAGATVWVFAPRHPYRYEVVKGPHGWHGVERDGDPDKHDAR